jgi:hypothetical protein
VLYLVESQEYPFQQIGIHLRVLGPGDPNALYNAEGVEFVVTATDAVAGRVPVRCLPRSGTQFSIGRTRVHCSATDTSACRGQMSRCARLR